MVTRVYYGTEGNDDLRGTVYPQDPHEIYGLGGNDTIRGALNYDVINGGDGNDIVYGEHIGPVDGFAHTDIIGGGKGDDQLYGIFGTDTLYGGSGADFLDGGSGDDVLYADYTSGVYAEGTDTLRGGDGNDVYIVFDANVAIVGNDPGYDRLESGVSISIATWQIEELTLTGGAVIGEGNAYGNFIRGNGVGNELRGLNGADTLYGFGGDDQLDGGNGVDTLYGSTGNDTYYVNAYYDAVSEIDGEGFDRVIATTSYVLANASSIEELVLGDGARDGTGNEFANRIVGNNAANTLRGGLGADRLEGSAGNDLYVLDDVYAKYSMGQPIGDYYDTVTEAPGGGIDTIWVSRQPGITHSWANSYYALGANIEDGRVAGSGDFDLAGNDLNNRLYGNADANLLEGGSGDDFLDGYLGADALVGGAGNDTYVLSDVYAAYFMGEPIGDYYDSVSEAAGAGIDTILVSRQPGITIPSVDNASYTLGANIENGTVNGAGGFDLTGNELANRLIGNGNVNFLDGAAGNDFLDGGAELDTLVGGLGNDTFVLNDVTALYFEGAPIGDFFDSVEESASGGIDTVRVGRQPGVTRPRDINSYTLGDNIEDAVVTGTGVFLLDGNGGNNRLVGNVAANALFGLGGDDVLIGGNGADQLRGGADKDRFDFDAVTESGITDATRDTILDFRRLIDDIDLSTIDARAGRAGNDAFSFIGTGNFTAEGQIRATQSGADTLLLINTSGNTFAEMSILLSNITATTLTAADFVL